MTPTQTIVADALRNGPLTLREVMAATGLGKEPARAALFSIASAKWVLKPIKAAAPSRMDRVVEFLAGIAGEGAHTEAVAVAAGCSLSQIKRWLHEGRDTGVIVARLDPTRYAPHRQRWYLAQHAPQEVEPPKPAADPRARKPKAMSVVQASRAVTQARDSAAERAAALAACTIKPTVLPNHIGERYAVAPPAVSALNSSECRAWAKAAAA